MANSPPNPPAENYVCPHCGSGSLLPKRVTLAGWYGGHFITLPNFPGWVCDVCGAWEYDEAALEQLEVLLGPKTKLPMPAGPRTRPGRPDFELPPGAAGRHRV